MSKAILECNGIAAGYVKGLNILQGVDLVVSEGEIVSIIGPNGAGKSTLLKAIMGLINVSAGRFYINGTDKTNLPTHKIVNQGVGYVPQVENVFPSLSIEENIEIGAWSLNKNRKSFFYCIHGKMVIIIRDDDGKYHEIETDANDSRLICVANGTAAAILNPSNDISKILVLADIAWRPNDNEMENVIFNDYNWNKWKTSE